MSDNKTPSWEMKIHRMILESYWEPEVEEWEVNESEQVVIYTLTDGSSLCVSADGLYTLVIEGCPKSTGRLK